MLGIISSHTICRTSNFFLPENTLVSVEEEEDGGLE